MRALCSGQKKSETERPVKVWDLGQKPTESERAEGPHFPQALTNQRPDVSQLDQSEASKYRPLSPPY